MKKYLMWAMVGALTLTACEKVEIINGQDDAGETGTAADPKTKNKTAVVRFSVDQWDVSTEPIYGAKTRAVTATEANMTDIWLMAYSADTLAAMVHQESTDPNFGSITMNLKYGKYYFYCVSSRGANAVVNKVSKTITWGSVRDTFWNVDSLNIRANTSESTSKTITLSRVVGRAILQLTDVVPEGAQYVTFKPSHWYYGICYLNGEPTADSDAEIAVDIPASYIGQQGLRVSYMSLSPADDWTTGMAIAMKGAGDAVLGRVTLSDVLMGRNKTVTMTGALLSGTRSLGVGLNDTWGDSNEITW
jgi:hypothetical protein